ncbi:hypothetical protein BJ138DRAFT_732785 [Hygrophoropsis aurantiaca]|uniref:Uncharacterized protein n=1 Tax=Hygrophoropsis aurantiaca TaxID=72124 RepID=A0ACB8AIQ2_9AGAM|nr:hypothetical protein BJ138DRAFT_732785 [Hygrophoropsis aurantiaca]
MYRLTSAKNALRAVPRAVPTTVRYTTARLYSSTMHDNDAEVLDREKRRNLSRSTSKDKTSSPHDDSPGWNETLASESEAHIKADRSRSPVHDLQRQTVNYIHAKHSPDERLETREATYTHDEVSGPLGHARVDQFEGVVGEGDSGYDLEETVVEPDGRTVRRHILHEETAEVLKQGEQTQSEANVRSK